jgi:uncharacterized protein
MKAQPVTQQERIQSIDVIRGFALMGILVINIQGMAMPWTAVEGNPASYGDLSGVNFVVWLIASLFFYMKMVNIFSMLFGVGLIIMCERWEARNATTLPFYYRRNFMLLLIGTFHAYLVWDGDILFIYAWCAFVVYWFRKFSPLWLLIFGIGIYLIEFGVDTLEYYHVLSMSPDQLQQWTRDYWDQPFYIQETIAGYRGDFWSNLTTRMAITSYWHLNLFVLGYYWAHPLGMMMMGMALYKWRVFSGKHSNSFYRNMVILGFGVGLAITGYGIFRTVQSDWDGIVGMFIGYRLLFLSAPLISLGWVGLIVWIYKSGYLTNLTKRFAAAGQMALTNYLMQTVIGTTLFYGFGFGWYGSLDRWHLMGITLMIWIFQLTVSPIWLNYFRFGPVEWLWRTLTYWKLQSFRR